MSSFPQDFECSYLFKSKVQVAESCERINDALGSVKGGKFLDKLSVLLTSQGLCSVKLV